MVAETPFRGAVVALDSAGEARLPTPARPRADGASARGVRSAAALIANRATAVWTKLAACGALMHGALRQITKNREQPRARTRAALSRSNAQDSLPLRRHAGCVRRCQGAPMKIPGHVKALFLRLSIADTAVARLATRTILSFAPLDRCSCSRQVFAHSQPKRPSSQKRNV
jgi:hypothetical protein